MDIFKKVLPDKKIPRILCDGNGEIQPSKDKVNIHFGAKPEYFTHQELAVVMANLPKLWELPRKLGVDPTKIKVTFEFEETGHAMPIKFSVGADEEEN